jgi:glucokinase-like ROK family protein
MNNEAGNVKRVKKVNRITVLSIIKEHEPISRQELSKITGLTPPAITGIVRELLEFGFVIEEGIGESSGGRRPVKLRFNQEAGFVVGIEVMMRETKVAIADLKNDPTQFKSFSLDMNIPQDGIKKLVEELKTLINSEGMSEKNFVGIGIAFPALISTREGIVKKSVNLGSLWDNFPLKEVMEEELKIPVFVENNSNVSALAERWFGGGTESRDLVYINLGEGISAGIIMNDRIVHGFQGHAGEIGHIVIRNDGPLCNCGNRGCLESICGIPALVRKANAELGLLITDDPLKELWEQQKKVNIDDILNCSQLEGTYAWQMVRQLGRDVGIGVANVINLYNPEVIFIGGKLSAAKDILLEPMCETIKTHSFPEIAKGTRVEISALGKNSGTIGACALAIRELFKPSRGGILDEAYDWAL